MARKIFVSYKHRDSAVQPIALFGAGTARDYVDRLETLFAGDHIYKGERGDEGIGTFRDETIESHLRAKIFDGSVTIVLISKNMKEIGSAENDQWIPWEVAYSLRTKTRADRTSSANAMLAVVLPDESGSYQYFIEQGACRQCSTITWKRGSLFNILGNNMFNRKQSKQLRCGSPACGTVFHTDDDHSYIHPVRWDYFVANINMYVELASRIKDSIDDYKMVKSI